VRKISLYFLIFVSVIALSAFFVNQSFAAITNRSCSASNCVTSYFPAQGTGYPGWLSSAQMCNSYCQTGEVSVGCTMGGSNMKNPYNYANQCTFSTAKFCYSGTIPAVCPCSLGGVTQYTCSSCPVSGYTGCASGTDIPARFTKTCQNGFGNEEPTQLALGLASSCIVECPTGYNINNCVQTADYPGDIVVSSSRCTFWTGTNPYFNPIHQNGMENCPSGSKCNISGTAECVRIGLLDGVCGTAARTYNYSEAWPGSYTYCNVGNPSPVSPANPTVGTNSTWTCQGVNGGNNIQTCTAVRAPQVYNGVCGSADGQAVTSAPTANLCALGTPSSVSGSGPWTWICYGVGPNHTDASCLAPLPGGGSCGTANNRTYSPEETFPGAYTYCSTGTAYPDSPATPGPGSSTSWECRGNYNWNAPFPSVPYSSVRVGMSDNGRYMAAAGKISSDYGITWRGIPVENVDVSGDGRYMTGAQGGIIAVSSDYGVTWTTVFSDSAKQFLAVGISDDGRYQTVVNVGSSPGGIWVSSNYGAQGSWSNKLVGYYSWYDVDVSATGQYQIAASPISPGSGGGIWRSINYGQTWTRVYSDSIYSVAMSSTGQYQIATRTSNSAEWLMSSDYGASWHTPGTWMGDGSSSSQKWVSCGISSDGKYQIVGARNGKLYMNSNYGDTASYTWPAIGGVTGWFDSDISDDGKYIFSTTSGGADSVDTFKVGNVTSVPCVAYMQPGGCSNINGTTFPYYSIDSASWLSGWSYKRRITIQHEQVDSDLTDFPLSVSFSGDEDLGSRVSNTTYGYDIRFTTADGLTLLPYERESFSVASGKTTANFWVKVPIISSSTDTIIYMYYGNASQASTDWTQTGTPTKAKSVWGTDYMGVWHLNNPANPVDSSLSLNNGTNVGTTATTGKLGGAALFNGTSAYIYTANTYLNPNNFTVSAWFKTSSTSSGKIVGLEQNQSGTTSPFADRHIAVLNGTVNYYWLSGQPKNINSASGYNDSNWHYATATMSANTGKLYVDGVYQGQATGGTYTYNLFWRMGSYKLPSGGFYFNGSIDEVRVANSPRNADWIGFEYKNIANPTNVLSIEPSQLNRSVCGFCGATLCYFSNSTPVNPPFPSLFSPTTSWTCSGGSVPEPDECSVSLDVVPPTVTGLNVSASYCGNAYANFSWTYNNSLGFTEKSFELQIDNNSNFASPEVSRSVDGLALASGSYNNQQVDIKIGSAPAGVIYGASYGAGQLAYDTPYYWRVKVTDSNNNSSSWVTGPAFTTADHAYPSPNFSASSESPLINTQVSYIDSSICYDDANVQYQCREEALTSYTWNFGGAGVGSPINTKGNTSYTYNSTGTKTVILDVCDSSLSTTPNCSDGKGICRHSDNVFVRNPQNVPNWQELSPF